MKAGCLGKKGKAAVMGTTKGRRRPTHSEEDSGDGEGWKRGAETEE